EAVLRLDEHHRGRDAPFVDGGGFSGGPWQVDRCPGRHPEASREFDDLVMVQALLAQGCPGDCPGLGHAHPGMVELALEVGRLLLGAIGTAAFTQIAVDRRGEGGGDVRGIGHHGDHPSTWRWGRDAEASGGWIWPTARTAPN